MRTILGLLILMRDYMDKHYSGIHARWAFTGLCSVARQMIYSRVVTCQEKAVLMKYLCEKYGKTYGEGDYWWVVGDYQVRYDAICECIEELKKEGKG